MAKVDFSRIAFKDVNGNNAHADVREDLGNTLYMQGRNIEECELGKAIYHSDGEVEVTEKGAEGVRYVAPRLYGYVLSTAIIEAVKP